MKKRGVIISVFSILLIGLVLFTGLYYLEKKDAAEYEKDKQMIAKQQEVLQQKSEQQAAQLAEKEQNTEITEGSESTGHMEVLEGTEPESFTSLLFAGDVYLSGHVTKKYDTSGITDVISEGLLEEMQTADIFMVNQEFPFGTVGTPMEDKQYTFRVHPSYVIILEDMGVDVVSLANNHVLDYGRETLSENIKTLEESQILYAGAGKSIEDAKALRTIEIAGSSYGFLSASRVIPVADWDVRNVQPGVFTTYDKSDLVEAIQNAKNECDFLTVYVHWGLERNDYPEEYQKELAHAYVDAGADLVIGAHPHVLQGIECYNGKFIFYSLGNYVFNQSIEKTMLLKVKIQDQEIEYMVIPAYAEGAKTMEYENLEGFYSYLEEISEGIKVEDGYITSGE